MDIKSFIPFKKDKKLGLQWRSKKAAMIWIGGFFASIFLFIFINIPDNNADQYVDKHEATVQAERFVEEKLKSPKSAKFSGITETNSIEKGIDEWEVTGWIEAANSFGADIRSNYKVIMKVNTDNGEWTVKDIYIE